MNDNEKMKVLYIEPEMPPKVIDMGTDLESLQRAVKGYIQMVYPFDDNVGIICNDEGKINGMQLNRALRMPDGEVYDALAGPFIVAGLTEDNFGSLSEEQIGKYTDLFKTPEIFVMMNGKLTVLSLDPNLVDTLSIYQLENNIPDKRDLRFAPYDELQRKHFSVDKANYSHVYTGKYNGESLDAIYERFNLQHPFDFRGHSLSVSDVVVIHQGGVDTAYYVDSYGFKQVPEFFASNPLEKVEELLEDDYGMIDGIVNNGSRKEDDQSKKSSVLEKLEEKKQESALLQVDAVKPEKNKSQDIDLG